MGATSNYAVIFLCPYSLASVFAFRLPQEMIKSAGQGYTLILLFIYIPETSLHMPRVWPSYQTYIFQNFQLLLLDIKSAVTKIQARKQKFCIWPVSCSVRTYRSRFTSKSYRISSPSTWDAPTKSEVTIKGPRRGRHYESSENSDRSTLGHILNPGTQESRPAPHSLTRSSPVPSPQTGLNPLLGGDTCCSPLNLQSLPLPSDWKELGLWILCKLT